MTLQGGRKIGGRTVVGVEGHVAEGGVLVGDDGGHTVCGTVVPESERRAVRVSDKTYPAAAGGVAHPCDTPQKPQFWIFL